jgi:hypothetical protein
MKGSFHESNVWAAPIKDLGLEIRGTRLEPILAEFDKEREQAGLVRLQPRYYLSTEWGVPFGTIALAIPFYLARPDLTNIQAEQTGFVEGHDAKDILRYLRHELGHVVNYAYKLYDREDWVKHFGSITQPYREDYRPVPFSTRYVRHLPGWYAQKHPDEDWAETFAVWMAPGARWQKDYSSRPTALAKLEYCDRVVKEIRDRDPLVVANDLDEDVGELPYTLEHFYQNTAAVAFEFPPGLDGALQAIFEDLGKPEDTTTQAPRKPAAGLIRKLERTLMANIYRWTGHFPERTRSLLQFLASRAEELNQVYPGDREELAVVALTTLVTSLAMNFVTSGNYLP